MAMPPRLRRVALTAHVTSSVGWLGAVACSLALAVAGLTSQDPQTVRAAFLILKLLGWSVLVPLSLASLLTGLIQALASPWGLLRHYWVVFKLLINIGASTVLLLYMETFGELAAVAREPDADLGTVRSVSPVLHATLAVLLLLIATGLAVYKPRGITPYGRSKQRGPGAVLSP